MKAWVEYTVPVLVQVDTQTGEVTRVIQVDEEVHASGKAFAHDSDGPGIELHADTAALLIRTADDGEWPAWEGGF